MEVGQSTLDRNDEAKRPVSLPIWRRPGVLALGVVVVTWAIAAATWPLSDAVVPWDSKNQFFAFFRFLATSLHEGSSPFWNPYHYAGHPSIADPQSLVFMPPFVIWAWFDAHPSLFAFDLLVYAHLLVGGVAMVFYGSRRGWPAAASVLAAFVFMFGGVVSSRLTHTGIIISYGLLPLALLTLEIALDKRSIWAAIGFGLTLGLIVLGRAQTPFTLALVAFALGLRHVVVQDKPLRYALSRLPVALVMGLVTIAIIAVPMVLTAQFAHLSNRIQVPVETALMASMHPVNIANFFVANVLGSLNPSSIGDWGPSHGTLPGYDSTDRAFNYMFAGSFTALLLLWHGLAGGRLLAPGRRVWTAIAAVALAYALGRYTPLFPFAFETIPGVSLFRRPGDALFVVVPAIAVLVGHLASDYVRQGLPKVGRLSAILFGLIIAGLAVGAVVFSARSDKALEAASAIGIALVVYGGLVALLMWAKTARQRVAVLSLAVAFTGGELVLRNTASSMNSEPRAIYALLEKPTPEATEILQTLEKAIQRDHAPGVRPRVEIVGLGGAWQNAAMVFGLEATNGYNPLRIGPYDRLVSPGESPYTARHRRFPTSFPTYDCLLGRLLGLEYVVLDRPITDMPNARQIPIADVVMAGPKVWIYRLPAPAPRVAMTTVVRVADADELIDQGRYLTRQSNGEVMVDDDDDLRSSYSPTPMVAPTAEIVSWRPDRVEIAVTSRYAAILTDRSPWYPGWEVEVDGVKRPLLRTDVLFRGVEVPAGAQRVVFTYRPLSAENLMAATRSALGLEE
ncbi:MAG: hypothetical protein WCH83_05855 [Alphaproteobacteria bacterium]